MTEEAQAAPPDGLEAAAPATVQSVGSVLAAARTGLGLSVAEVAQQLKFAPRQIEALEQDRFEELPAGTFARGMLRSYARLLKLDAEPLVERIAARVATPDNAAVVASARRPIPITDSARRSNVVYAALSIGLLVVIAAVVFEWQRERSADTALSFVPAANAPQETTSAVAASTAPLPAEPQRIEVASAAAQATPAPLAAPAVPAAASPGTGAERRIRLRFAETSWVEIRAGDGKVLLSQLNPGGTEQVVEGRPPFALVIGNAQHVRLSYDDKPVDLAPHVKVEVARLTLD